MLVPTGTRYSETLFLKLDTDASIMTSTKQNSISEEIEFLPKGILIKQFWTKCKGGPFAKFWKSAILLLNFERLENSKYQSDFSLIDMDGRAIYSSL